MDREMENKMHDKVDWVLMLVDDGVDRDEAVDMAVDYFGIEDAAVESFLRQEIDFWRGKPKG